jgi:hypothetical protein
MFGKTKARITEPARKVADLAVVSLIIAILALAIAVARLAAVSA